MSIYATLRQLKSPRYGDAHTGCDWIEVKAQGVPAHIGSFDEDPEADDPYAAFLPPAIAVPPDDSDFFAAAVFSCMEGALERTNIAAQQIKSKQAEVTPTARRRVARIKGFLPVRAGCPNSTCDPSGRNWNSPGCPAHRQSFLCPPSCAFRRVLDLHRIYVYSHASNYELLPLLHLSGNHARNSIQECLPRRNRR